MEHKSSLMVWGTFVLPHVFIVLLLASLLVAIHSGRMLFYSLGLQIAGIALVASAVSFIVTILTMRAPGVRLMRLPVFTWMNPGWWRSCCCSRCRSSAFLGQLMLLTASGRRSTIRPRAATRCCGSTCSGSSVNIMILPAFGDRRRHPAGFSRKPLFDYSAVVFAGIAIE